MLSGRDERIKALVLLATPSCVRALTEEQVKRAKEKGYIELESGRRLKQDFFEDFTGYNLCQEIHKIRCPILIMHGSTDEVVPVKNAYTLYDNAQEPKRLEIIEGGDHRFNDPEHVEKIVNLSLEWFKRYL